MLDAAAGGASTLASLRDAVAARGARHRETALSGRPNDLAGLGLLEEPAGDAVACSATTRPALRPPARVLRGPAPGRGRRGSRTGCAMTPRGDRRRRRTGDLDRVRARLRGDRAPDPDRRRQSSSSATSTAGAVPPRGRGPSRSRWPPRRLPRSTQLACHRPRDAHHRTAPAAERSPGQDFVVELADWPPYDLGRWLEPACWPTESRDERRAVPAIVRIGPTYVPGTTPASPARTPSAPRGLPAGYEELADLRGARTHRRAHPRPTVHLWRLVAMDVVHHLTGIATPATLGAALLVDLRDLSVEREPPTAREGCERCGGRAASAPEMQQDHLGRAARSAPPSIRARPRPARRSPPPWRRPGSR